MTPFSSFLIIWLNHVSLDQWGLILNFIGGLMMAIDFMGRERAERLEKAVQRLTERAKAATAFLLRRSNRALVSFISYWRAGLWLFYLLAAMTICRFVLPLTGGKGLFYTLVIEVWGVLYVVTQFAVTVTLPFIVLFVVALAALWTFRIVAWIIMSPLILGQYLKVKHGFKAAVPFAGILVVSAGFLLQLIASFRK